jgi:hypothetical protein
MTIDFGTFPKLGKGETEVSPELNSIQILCDAAFGSGSV